MNAANPTASQPKNMTLTASDGFTLWATLFEPTSSNGRVVLLNSAMAVKRGFYAKYAAYLAVKGFTILTYDYRGIGDSRPVSLRGFEAHLWEWGAKDMAAAVGWIRAQYPGQKLLVVGHSVGGQIIGLTPENQHIEAFFGVAVQSAYWRLWSGIWRWRMFALWYVLFPALTPLLGYFPGKLGVGEDLPAGVALDWSGGGRKRKYLLDLYGKTEHNYFAAFKAPFIDYSFSDDDYAPYQSVEDLLTFYPNASKTHKHVQPSEGGLPAIGHFGFFRSKAELTLWAESAAWLLEH